ncbi:hypothetical protein JCM10450v2_004585 [Rhodotorula kratochvilovae]
MSGTSAAPAPEAPWHAAFPAPTATLADNTLAAISIDELKTRLTSSNTAKEDVLVVDVRRTDFEIGFIRGAVNLPAHSFYPTLPSLLPILSRYRAVVFHCQSSSGRGPRCAGWYQDALDAAGIPPEQSRAAVLTGGIKAWLERFGEDEVLTVKL